MDNDVITVVLADDHAVVRYGLRAVLQTAPDITVIGEARNGREAVDTAMRLKPDVVVMDLGMDGMDGAAATRELQKLGSASRILILTMHAEDEHLVRLLEAGASGYLVKNAADRELVDAIRMVARGDQYLQLGAVRALARELKKREYRAAEQTQYESLSDRERSILRLIAAGYTGPDIGAQLNISAKTVDTYKQRIQEKIGLAHRPDYVRFAVRLGLLDEEART
jgi:two-component system, NarL family, response regulator NreC